MRRVWMAPAAALALIAAAPAVDVTTSVIDRLKPLVVADPAGAIPAIRAERRRLAGVPDPAARATALATTQWLEADARIRLDDLDGAAGLLKAAWEGVDRYAPRSPLKARILLSRGGLSAAQVQPAAALADFQAAFRLFQQARDARSQAATLLNIASLYSDANDHASVLRYADQAEAIFHDEPVMRLAIANTRGTALIKLGRTREAERAFGAALKEARLLGSPVIEVQVLRNIARAQLAAGEIAPAQATVDASYAVSSRAGPSDERAMLALAAQAAFQQGQAAQAEGLIRRSFDGVDPATTTLSSREAHETAWRVFDARGEDRLALVHLAALKRLDDEATKLATSTGTALMAARFDFANQELRIANLQRDEARRTVAFERARIQTQRAVFLTGAAAVTAVILMLVAGLFAIRRSRDEVRAAAGELRVSNHALARALAARTEFLATTSHEIRTPLNGILGMTQVMLADARLGHDTRDRIGIVHAAGETMRALVDDILDVAKIETGHLTIEDARYDLAATLDGAARLWRDQAAANGIGFQLDLDECPTSVIGDAARVRQIAFNLLSNAVKFTREGDVSLAARRVGERVEVVVRDTGIGIPSDKIDLVFESFRQADTGTTREFGGTGLGLAICRSLAEAMGGSVTVASTPDVGSTFTLSLPWRPAEAPAESAEQKPGGDLLVVERNPISRAMYQALFTGQGVAPVIVPDAAAAVAAIRGGGVARMLADATILSGADGEALVGAAAAGGIDAVALTGTGATAPAGWRVLARPVSRERLVEAVLGRPFTESRPEPLAGRAA